MLHGNEYDPLIRDYISKFDESLRRPWPTVRQDFLKIVKTAGLDVTYDKAATKALAEQLARLTARYSRTFPVENLDGSITWKHVPGTVDPALKAKAADTLTHLGWSNPKELFPFAFKDACEVLTKQDALVALFTGAGKSRTALAIADGFIYQENLTSPTIIIAQKRHLRSWREELGGIKKKDPCQLIVARYGRGCYEEFIEKDDKPTYQKPYLLVSFERLVRCTEEQLDELSQVAKGSVLILDEAYSIANQNAQRSKGLARLQGRHHIALSATPFKGYVTSLLNVLQWTFRGGSLALPDYPTDRAGSARKFSARFATKARSESGNSKTVPYIRNLDQLQDLLAPLMVRRLRAEPEVCAVLGEALLEEHSIDVELNKAHRDMYVTVLKSFTDWYKREIASRRKQGKSASLPQNEILVKLGYLARGVSQPWRMHDHSDNEFNFPAYPRIPTSLHEKAMEIAEKHVAEDDAVLIFGFMTDQLDLMAQVLRDKGYAVGVIHGGIPQDQRDREISRLQQGETQILLGSYGVAAEGLNLNAASVVICTEWDWTPSVIRQAVGRIMRGIQQFTPIAYYLTALGTVQEYQRRLCNLKSDASSAALDHSKQKARDEDILDINAYCQSLVGVADEEQVESQGYALELEEEAPMLLRG